MLQLGFSKLTLEEIKLGIELLKRRGSHNRQRYGSYPHTT